MDIADLETLELGARDDASACIVWLHGLGADGYDFEPIVPELGLPGSVRFVFPHAPVRPVTLNNGLPMRAWYDIYGLGGSHGEDDAGIRASEQQVQKLIAREVDRGVPPDRIVLAGFSQGGAVALHTGLRLRDGLAGIAALSTYLPLAASLEREGTRAGRGLPIFMAHGSRDPVVPFAAGERSREHLRGLGYTVEWHDYPIEHSVSMAEIRDIAAWLRRVLVL